MEYAGGGELYTYVHQNGKLTEEVARPIFAQLVSAVTHLVKKINYRMIYNNTFLVFSILKELRTAILKQKMSFLHIRVG